MDKTPVALLQELLVKRQLMPTYNLIVNGTGTHDPIFKYEVAASGERAVGSGKSKKEAKHAAARELLTKLSEGNSVPEEEILEVNITSPFEEVLKDNAVGMLTDFCTEKNLRSPTYDLIRNEGLPHAKLFSFRCNVSSFSTEANARTKKQAKQLAAQEMLNKLKVCLENCKEKNKENEANNIDKSTEVIMKKVKEMRPRRGNSVEQLGIKIANYYKIFKEDTFPKSELLESIKDLDRVGVQSMETPADEICRRILDQLDFQFKIEELPSVESVICVCLTIEGPPTWSFFARSTSNIEDACSQVFLEALIFMADMAK